MHIPALTPPAQYKGSIGRLWHWSQEAGGELHGNVSIQAARSQYPWYVLPPPMTIARQWGSWGKGKLGRQQLPLAPARAGMRFAHTLSPHPAGCQDCLADKMLNTSLSDKRGSTCQVHSGQSQEVTCYFHGDARHGRWTTESNTSVPPYPHRVQWRHGWE